MMKPGRRWVSTHPMACIALMLLAAMVLAFSAACRAGEAAAASDPAAAAGPAAPAPDAAASPEVPSLPAPEGANARIFRHGPSRHLTAAQSIDESVNRLARGLDLDQNQRERLRQILIDQRRRIIQLRSGGTPGAADLTGAMLAIYDQTRERIRAMLNQEQLKKYPAAVPRDQMAPAQADLQHWLQLKESAGKQNDGAAK